MVHTVDCLLGHCHSFWQLMRIHVDRQHSSKNSDFVIMFERLLLSILGLNGWPSIIAAVGRQCAFMSLAALLFNRSNSVDLWTQTNIDDILCHGDRMYLQLFLRQVFSIFNICT